MNPRIAIREATSEDAEVLAGIIRESFRNVAERFSLTPENSPKHPSNCTTEWIESDQKRGVQYFILSQNSEPIGCVGLERADSTLCYIERLAVLPEMRRRGYGRELMLYALERAKEIGVSKVSIGVIAAQDELKAWYAYIGFVPVGTKTFEHLPFQVAFMEFDIRY